MATYELRLTCRVERQTNSHKSSAPACIPETTLHVYVKNPRRADMFILAILRPLNTRLQQFEEYEMIIINDFMIGMSNSQRYHFLLKVQEGLSKRIFSCTWARGGSQASVYPHVI